MGSSVGGGLKADSRALHSGVAGGVRSSRRSVIAKEADTSSLDPLRRFSDRVDDYVRYRPGYPKEVIRLLRAKGGLSETSVVADVGAGTGIFTKLLLETGAAVVAVEPNDAMREAAEDQFHGCGNFRSVKGSAEATGLPDGSVSLITCAQAFHWFKPVETRGEFLRILTGGGCCAMIWNTAILDASEFAVGYERIKEEFGTDFRHVRHDYIENTGRFDTFFGKGNWEKQEFGNSQTLDLRGLKGRLLSSSYAPKEGHVRHKAMMAELEDLFRRCSKDGVVRMEYKTEVFLGRLA
jgi:SAM-dependent methyltransferase